MYERVTGRVSSRGETHPDDGVSLAREQPQAAATSARDIGGEGNRFKGDEPSFLLFIILPGGLHGGARSTPHALATAATRTSVARRYAARRARMRTRGCPHRKLGAPRSACKFPRSVMFNFF